MSEKRIISLNLFAGRVYQPLVDFIRLHAATTDIFCFQEVTHTTPASTDFAPMPHPQLFTELSQLLPEFEGAFASSVHQVIDGKKQISSDGIAIFVRRGQSVTPIESFVVFREEREVNSEGKADLYEGFAQKVHVKIGEDEMCVIHLHGAPYPGDKRDTPERLAQSESLLRYVREASRPCIVLGDFNLLPETESVRCFERQGFRNLIAEYRITTTRGSYNKILHPKYDDPKYGRQEFADYAFVSEDIQVSSFSVPDVPISDHLPLIVEVDLRDT